MEDKIKRLATNLAEIIPEPKEPQQVWDSLRFLMREQRDYFQKIPPENIIKVIFYVWSLKETGNLKLGEKMLNEISFALIFHHEGNYHKETCGHCDGQGSLNCYECDSGKIECSECNGGGDETCEECDGSGEIENDGETLTCSECGGEGVVSCGECGGDGVVECNQCIYGNLTCNDCEGDGDVDTNEYEFFEHFIVTWDGYIKNRCEITEEDTDITMSEYEFDKRSAEFITLGFEESHAKFEPWVEENEMYCAYYSDNPRLEYNSEMEIVTSNYNLNYAAK